MINFLAAPLFRQLVQFLAGVVATTGVMTEDDATTAVGAVSSLANIGWMVYSNVKNKK
jgi:hypothetical protein